MAPRQSNDSSNTCICGKVLPTAGALKNHRNKCLKYQSSRRSKPGGNIPPPTSALSEPGPSRLAPPSPVHHPELESSTLDPTYGTQSESAHHEPRQQLTLSRSGSFIPGYHSDRLPPPPPIAPEAFGEILAPNRPAIQHQTETNSFGVYRVYQDKTPSYIPDADFDIHRVCDNPAFEVQTPAALHSNPDAPPPPGPFTERPAIAPLKSPYETKTEDLFMSWYFTGGNNKSLNDMNVLARNVIGSKDFRPEELRDFDAAKSARRLDLALDAAQPLKDGWKRSSVPISLPHPRYQSPSENDAPVHMVEGLLHRSLTEVITSCYSERSASDFHTAPFEEFWTPHPDLPAERIYSELYNSDALLREHNNILSQQSHTDGHNLEPVVMPIMLWSDATHLTSFGDASLWPIYLHNGYQSKYSRAKPTSFAAHHIAYIPKLDDAIQDTYKQYFNDKPSAETLTHLRRELIQAVWRLLLDDEFMEAYKNGIEILFPDGIYRRVFPRFFTYSADYPEKVLLTCIKFLGNLPCPRCEVEKHQIRNLGQKRDMKQRNTLKRVDNQRRREVVAATRKLIYEKGYSVTSTAVKALLDTKSWTATTNAFSESLFPHGFDFYSIFAVDLLHEFELGVWKATFTHLMRILFVAGDKALQVLNIRYRQVPPFGRAIRRFSSNASAMKKLAARDFEDLLQCALPVFEGLLDAEHDRIVAHLLFELATWHALAKLRLHTSSTIVSLEASTARLGDGLRKFESSTARAFHTVDLPSEEAARARRKKGKQQATSSTTGKTRKFNMETYKLHALGDYAHMIRLYGPTDGYSTQIGELEHRRCKQFYPRVHKGKKHYAFGIAMHISRQRRMRNLGKELGIQMTRPNKKKRLAPRRKDLITEEIRSTSASEQYLISDETRNPIRVNTFLASNSGDPAVKDFLPRLRDHILGRLLNQRYDGDDNPFSDRDRAEVLFRNHTIFEHKTLRVNYTTYDMRREQDTLNPRTNTNIMMLSPDGEEHPYWYAKIIGIYHVLVSHRDLQPTPTLMNFLWVRWYGMEPARSYKFGWKARKLPRIGFVDGTNDDPLASPPFGFVDPAHVIRSVHLIPAFHHGHTQGLLGPTELARNPDDENSDWNFFYVNIFADRDMVMRFRGGGVGHFSTRKATDRFLLDRSSNDPHWSLHQGSQPGSDKSGDQESDANEGGKDSTDESTGMEGVVTREEDELDEPVNSDEEEDYGYVDWNERAEEEEEEDIEHLDDRLESLDDDEDETDGAEGVEGELGYAPY